VVPRHVYCRGQYNRGLGAVRPGIANNDLPVFLAGCSQQRKAKLDSSANTSAPLPPVPPPLERYRNVIFLVVTLAIVSGVIALVTYRPPATEITIIPPPPTATSGPTDTPGPMHIYVTGSVANPGVVYVLPPGSRVSDAIAAAGGLNDDADVERVNQAALLHDGDQIEVPVIGSKSSASNTQATPSGPVHINTATIDDLRALPNCGPKLAQQIIDYRQQNGPFKSMTDLGKVPGVGKTRLQEWQSLIVFN